MRYRSEKRQKLYVERRALVEELLSNRPRCEACGPRKGEEIYLLDCVGYLVYKENRAVDVHELKRRSQGGSILDPKNLITVCRDCHRWINDNPEWATHLGLSLPGWATDEMYEEAKMLRDGWRRGVGMKRPSWERT